VRKVVAKIALAQGAGATADDFMIRWRTIENAKGRRVGFWSMRNHDDDIRTTSLDMALRYTTAL
jgi:hypothetical protein